LTKLHARTAAFLAALVIAFVPIQQAAAVEIAVLVNGAPITTYDIDQRVALQRVSGQTPSRSTATEQLIDEAIQVGAAASRGVVVTEGQVDSAFANIARQVNLSVSQFSQALWEAGVNPDTLRRQIRAQIYWSILIQARLQIEPAVRQEDVTERLLAQGAEQTVREYVMQQIIFVVPDGAGNSYVNQRRSEAEAFRQRFQSCETSRSQAANLRDVTVRDIGRNLNQLSQSQQQSVEGTQAGGTTRPERTSLGIEVIAICSVTEVQSNERVRSEIQNELLVNLGDEIGQEYLAELREQAVIIRY